MKIVQRGVAVASAAVSLSFGAAASAGLAADEIIVTAARFEQPIGEVIGSASVITREDIQRRMATSLQDLLHGETGVQVINSGGPGKLSNVFLRGADAEQALVLIDGVRVGSATSGTTAFEFLPLDQIERIEIVRGPRSSLYGADAIGGVIQIFTRRTNGASISVGAGSHETYDTSATFGASGENAWFSVSAAHLRTDGYNSCRGAPFPPGGGCFTYEPDADGYDNTSGSLRTGYRWGERAEVEASALHASGNTEFDGDFGNQTDFTQRVLTLRGRVRPTERWTLALIAGDARDERDDLYVDPTGARPALHAGYFETVRRNLSVQSDMTFASDRQLTLGADYLDDRIASATAYEATSRDNVGLFAQWRSRIGSHEWLLSGRHDDNEQFGGYDTGSVGWRWTLSPQLSLNAAWGSAFGAPTFNDLYYPGFSNPDLDPERSQSYELGASGRAGRLSWSASVFENRIEDLIVFVTSAPDNLHEARVRGVELEASLDLQAWSVGLGYSGLDPRNRTSGASHDNLLPRRARHSGHVQVGRSFGPIETQVRLTAAGARYDDLENTQRLGGYAVVDVVFDYALSAAWSVRARIGNALDHEYETAHLYPQNDRTFYASVSYRSR